MRLSTLRMSRITALLLVMAFLSERVALAIPTLDASSAKQQIAARGVGNGVKGHEADGTVLRGKIVWLKDDSFGLHVGSKPSVEVAFANVRAVDGPGLSKGAKIGIGVGVAVVATVAIVLGVKASHPLSGFHLWGSHEYSP